MTDEESLHLRYYRKTMAQIWMLVLISMILSVVLGVIACRVIAYFDIQDLKRHIDGTRCSCQNFKIEANNTGIHISQRSDPAEQLAREILQNQGDIKR